MKDSRLYRWLLQQNCLITDKTVDTRAITHTSMDGACIHIEPSRYPEFCSVYAEGVEVYDETYFICERPSEVVRMFCDFDFALTYDEISPETMRKYVEILYNVVNRLYNEDFKIHVSAAPCKRTTKRIKSGFHLVWPDLYITCDQARLLRKELIEHLRNFDGQYNWNTIVDGAVYTSGLRLLGSQKMVRKSKEWKTEFRPYTLRYIYPESERLTLEQCLRVACIRTYFPVHTNIIVNPFEYVPEGHGQTNASAFSAAGAAVPGTEAVRSNIKELSSDEIEIVRNELVTFFNACSISGWHNQNITNINKIGETTYCIVTDSRYCLNIQGEHNSNHIYFVIVEDGLRQLCHCACETLEGRKYNVLCGKFASNLFPLPHNLKKKLFPDATLQRTLQRAANKSKQTIKLTGGANEDPDSTKYMSNEFLRTKNYSQYENMIKRTLDDIKAKCVLKSNADELSANQRRQLTKTHRTRAKG